MCWVCKDNTNYNIKDPSYQAEFYGGPQGQNTTQYWAGYTTIFRDAKQFFTVHNKLSRYKTIFHSAQQAFQIQNNFSQCTTSFRDTKQFFTVHNKLSRYKTIFHSAQQAFEQQNKFSRCTTSFHDAVDSYVEQNSISRCKIKFHDAQQKFERVVTSTGNFISCDHTNSCSLPPCFVNTRATQLTMAASLLPTGDEKEIITYYFSRGYEYYAIVHFLAKFHVITMSIRTLKNRLRRYQLRRRTPTHDLNLVREATLRELSGPGCSGGYRSVLTWNDNGND